jgi:hypothetical protein
MTDGNDIAAEPAASLQHFGQPGLVQSERATNNSERSLLTVSSELTQTVHAIAGNWSAVMP